MMGDFTDAIVIKALAKYHRSSTSFELMTPDHAINLLIWPLSNPSGRETP